MRYVDESNRKTNPSELILKLKTENVAVLSPPLMEYLVVLDENTTDGGTKAESVKTSRDDDRDLSRDGSAAVDSTVTKWGP